MGNDYIEAARLYHAATKHSYASVRSFPRYLDWDNRPLPYKIYPEAQAFALGRDLVLPAMATLGAISAQAAENPEAPLQAGALARILFCAGGITRSRRFDAGEYHFRAAPSAGALYPVEIYVAAAEVDGLEEGLHHFSPADLSLRGIRRGDWREAIARAAGAPPSLRSARAIIILSAIFWRSAWKYGARAYRYCFWDAGAILANLLAAATAEGLAAEIVTAFADPEIEALIGVDGEREGVVCLVAIGSSRKALVRSPELSPLQFEAIGLSKEEASYQDLVRMHRESRLLTAAQAAEVRRAGAARFRAGAGGGLLRFDAVEARASLGLGETILRRGSARVFARTPIPARELAAILSASSRHPRADFPPLTEAYLIVNAAEGLEAGAYYYDREREGFELLKLGDFRADAGYLCLEQALGRDCAALIVYMANLERALGALGNRGYRDAHLEAGILAGRAYLAAYSLGYGASGLTFYDDDTTEFFGPHAAGKSPLLMVAAGAPGPRAAQSS